ncbi:MAG: PGF-pre-PGF domain-containing protein [Candidatus Aenigmarchaeota archaeon]|nr:PGF-pre-PGF domain-containing protein [Candidatus Aenigmarchaeota archaeon]
MDKKLLIPIATMITIFYSVSLAFAASLSVASVTIPSSINQGDSFTLSASISGSDVTSVSSTLDLPSGISCTPTGSQSVSLDGSGSGTVTWSCTGNVAGDYTNRITVSVSGTDSSTGGSVSDSEQTGLKVLSPASLTASSTISSTSVTAGSTVTFTVGVNNAGDLSTTYSITISCPTGTTCSPTSVASNSISGNTLENNAVTVTGGTVGSYTLTATVSGNSQTLTTSKSLTVTAALTSDDTTTTTPGGTVPGTKVTLEKGKATITIPSIAAGKSATVDITKTEDVAFRKIVISVANAVNNIQVTVTKLADKPATVAQDVTGKVYHYIQVDKNVSDTAVNQTTIRFAVAKTWLTNNSINDSTVVLNRYVAGNVNAWTELATSKIGELSGDTENIVYEAISPGLSVFAITGKTTGEVTTPSPTPTPEVTPISTPSEVAEQVKKDAWKIVIIVVVFVAVVAGAVILNKKGIIKLDRILPIKKKASWDELKRKYSRKQ